MTTERVATRVSDAEMERRWAAVRKLMKERGIEALVAYGTEDWLGGHARWFTDIPTHNGYGRTVVFHADDLMSVVEQGNFGARRELAGKDPYHRGVGEIRLHLVLLVGALHHRLIRARSSASCHQEARLQDHRLRRARHDAAQADPCHRRRFRRPEGDRHHRRRSTG